jgi:hypothetical protein
MGLRVEDMNMTSIEVWVLHSPYPNGTWRGDEKCCCTEEDGGGPRLFLSKQAALDFLEVKGVGDNHYIPVQCVLVTPSVGALVKNEAQSLSSRELRKTEKFALGQHVRLSEATWSRLLEGLPAPIASMPEAWELSMAREGITRTGVIMRRRDGNQYYSVQFELIETSPRFPRTMLFSEYELEPIPDPQPLDKSCQR